MQPDEDLHREQLLDGSEKLDALLAGIDDTSPFAPLKKIPEAFIKWHAELRPKLQKQNKLPHQDTIRTQLMATVDGIIAVHEAGDHADLASQLLLFVSRFSPEKYGSMGDAMMESIQRVTNMAAALVFDPNEANASGDTLRTDLENIVDSERFFEGGYSESTVNHIDLFMDIESGSFSDIRRYIGDILVWNDGSQYTIPLLGMYLLDIGEPRLALWTYSLRTDHPQSTFPTSPADFEDQYLSLSQCYRDLGHADQQEQFLLKASEYCERGRGMVLRELVNLYKTKNNTEKTAFWEKEAEKFWTATGKAVRESYKRRHPDSYDEDLRNS